MNPQIYRGLNWGQLSSTFDDCIGIFSRVDSRIPKQAMAGGSCGGTGRRSAGLCHPLTYDTAGTIAEVKKLHARDERPNLFVKIPGTPEGIPAIEESNFSGVPFNLIECDWIATQQLRVLAAVS
jgi:hypothetical protein